MSEKDEKIDLYVPLKYKPGEYGIYKLNRDRVLLPSGCGFRLTFSPSGKCVSRQTGERPYDRFSMDGIYYSNFDRLTAVYGEDGKLRNIGITEWEKRRFLYIRMESLEYARNIIRCCAGKLGRELAQKVLLRREKGRARRLFAEYYVDSHQFDYHVIYASEQEVREVWDEFAEKYGEEYVDKFNGNWSIHDLIDNSGEYSHADENMDVLGDDGEYRISMMLTCVPEKWWEECFDTVIETLDSCVKEIIPQLDKTEDFKFISEIYD